MSSTHNDNPDRIETEVEEARARLTRTLDEIRERMSPGQILDQALDYARHSGGGEFTRNLGRSVRDNPLPLLMMGAGMAWLMASDRRQAAGYVPAARYGSDHYGEPADTSPGYRERAGNAASSAGHAASSAYRGAADTAGGVASSVRGAVSGAASAVGSAVHAVTGAASDAASTVGGAASSMGQHANSMAGSASSYGRSTGESIYGYGADMRRGWSRLLEEQPLIAGAIGLAIGAAIGAALPATRAEDRLMGGTSDRIKDEAWRAARDGYSEATRTASEVADDARRTVDEKGLSGASIGEAIDRAAEKIGDRAGLKGDGAASGERSAASGAGSASAGTSTTATAAGRPGLRPGETPPTATPSSTRTPS